MFKAWVAYHLSVTEMTVSKKGKFVVTLSLLIIATGIILMAIMLLNVPYPETWFPKYVQIKFNNAFCITLIGACFFLFQFENNKKIKIFYFVLSISIILISTLTLAEHFFNIDTGIDQLFLTDRFGKAANEQHPGRVMAPAALVFLFFGLSLFGFGIKSHLINIISQYALHAVSFILAILLVGFLYSDSFFNNLDIYGLNYLYEGTLLFIMSVTASFLHPSLGISRLFSGNHVGNKMARRLFILMAGVILFFGIIKLKFSGLKLWQFDTGFSLFIICLLLVALLIIWHTASWLNKIDIKRCEAEKEIKILNEQLEMRVAERTEDLSDLLEKFRESESKFRTLAERSMVGIYISQKEKFIYVNPCFAQIFGYKPEEIINFTGSPVDLIIGEEDRAMVRHKIQKRYHGEAENAHYQVRGKRKDGTQNYVEFFGSRVIIDGKPAIIGTMLDVTENKRAGEELKSSELKYKLLFESNPQALWMIAKDDLSIISVNRAATDLYGYHKDELLNKNVAMLRPAEDLAKLSDMFQQDFSNSADVGVIRHLKKDGSVMFVQIISNDIVFEGRKVRLSLTTDVTEKLKAEDSLKKSEANLRTILDTTGTAYALLDKELNIIAFNPMAVKFVNIQLNQFPEKARQIIDLMPAERVPQFLNYANDVLRGTSISYEVNYPLANGSPSFLNVRMFPIKNNENEIFGMLVEVSDITEIKKYTNAIEEQNKKFKEIAWLQSHIVRAPLARMMGIINLLRDNNLDITEHREFLQHLSTSADELDAIIKDITEKAQEIKMKLV